MRSSRKNLKLRHGSVNVVRQRFEIFPITTELSRLLCCLLYGLQTEEMKNLFKGKSLVYVRRCQFQSSIPTFLLCLRLIDMFSANEHAEFLHVCYYKGIHPKRELWFLRNYGLFTFFRANIRKFSPTGKFCWNDFSFHILKTFFQNFLTTHCINIILLNVNHLTWFYSS